MADRHALNVDVEGSSPSTGFAFIWIVSKQTEMRFLPVARGMKLHLERDDGWFKSSQADFSAVRLADKRTAENYGALAEW